MEAIEFALPRKPLNQDKRIWCLDSAGSFSIKSLRKLIVNPPGSFPFKQIWTNYIPPKVSVFLWKVIHGILPTDNKVQQCGILLCSKCSCCQAPQTETASHLLLCSELARTTWRIMGHCFQINPANCGSGQAFLRQVIQQTRIATQAGMVSLLLASLWLWEVWCERNKRRFEGKHSSPTTIYHRIIQRINNTKFPACSMTGDLSSLSSLQHLSIATNLQKRRDPIIVYWSPPPHGTFKLNIDGASKGNPGNGGGGGLIRDHKGDICLAFSHYYGRCYSLIAEARAMLDGLRYAALLGINLHIVESDSKILVSIIKEECSCPWRLLPIIAELRELVRRVKTNISHIFREGNQPADGLANFACHCNFSSTFHNNLDMIPARIRGACRLDRMGIPNLRL